MSLVASDARDDVDVRDKKKDDIGNSGRLAEVVGDSEALGLSVLRVVIIAVSD